MRANPLSDAIEILITSKHLFFHDALPGPDLLEKAKKAKKEITAVFLQQKCDKLDPESQQKAKKGFGSLAAEADWLAGCLAPTSPKRRKKRKKR